MKRQEHRSTGGFAAPDSRGARYSAPLQLKGAPEVELVGGADFGGDGDGEAFALADGIDWFEVDTDFVEGEDEHTGGGAGDYHFVAAVQFAAFHLEFCHAQAREVAHAFRAVFFHAGGG